MCSDPENKSGYYQTLKCNKHSSTTTINHTYTKTKQHYYNIAATHHPDKTNNEAKITLYEERNIWYGRITDAYKVLRLANEDGHFKERVKYNISVEVLRKQSTMLFVARYSNKKLFINRAKEITPALSRANIFKQGVVRKIINKGCELIATGKNGLTGFRVSRFR